MQELEGKAHTGVLLPEVLALQPQNQSVSVSAMYAAAWAAHAAARGAADPEPATRAGEQLLTSRTESCAEGAEPTMSFKPSQCVYVAPPFLWLPE